MTEGQFRVDPLGAADPERPDIYMRVTLKSGLHLVIRPLHPEDRAALADGFVGLSERSKYLRFLTGKGVLSSRGLDKLVDQVDQHDHVALALWWTRRSQADVLLGDARFIRLPADPECADVVRRGFVASVLCRSVLDSIPLEVLRAPPTPEGEALMAERLRLARVLLDLQS